jgi:hypothetical protein
MNGEAPKFFIRDRDDKFGAAFDRVARGSGMRVIQTAVHAPNMNAVMDRFLRSVRTEVLDQVLVVRRTPSRAGPTRVREVLQRRPASSRARAAHSRRLYPPRRSAGT